MEDLEGMIWSVVVDRWKWGLEESGYFSVSSSYRKLVGIVLREEVWNEAEKRVFVKIWKSPAPSKVVAFSWKLLYDRIPTRVNLAIRNVLPTDAPRHCAFCERFDESSSHLFLHCDVAMGVWQGIMRWWERVIVILFSLFTLWECWCGGEWNKIIRKGLRLIWHATVWVLWKARNDKVFNGRNMDVEAIVEEIKVWSWKWSLDRMPMPPCMFYEWCWSPKDCLVRVV